jgi:hypothetical protein
MNDISENQKLLEMVEKTQESIRSAIQAHYSAPFMMTWGILWSVAFILTHYFLAYVIFVWGVTVFIGITISILLWRRILNKGPINSSQNARFPVVPIVAAWVFTAAVLVIFSPSDGIQFNAIGVLLATYSLFLVGYSFQNPYIIGTSIVATSATISIYLFAPQYSYSLFMAGITGPSLVLGGLVQFINRKSA